MKSYVAMRDGKEATGEHPGLGRHARLHFFSKMIRLCLRGIGPRGVGLPERLGRKLEIVRSWVRFPGQVMILGRNGTDDQDEQVEGLIAGAVVANTNVASAHPRPVLSHQ